MKSFLDRSPLRLVTVVMAFAYSSLVSANVDLKARKALLDMVYAMEHLNYQGILVYARDGKIEPMKIFHAVRDGVEQERVVALNSPLREVIRDVDKVTCYYPDSRKVVVEHYPPKGSFLLKLPEDIDSLALTYSFDLAGQEHIALRPAQIININPKDEYRYKRRIWMDVETNLPLKFELIDETGAVIEQATFTSLQLDDSLPIKSLHADLSGQNFTWHVQNNEMLPPKDVRFVFGSVPTGFRQVRYARRKMRNSEFPVEHFLFSDGFSSVSVYVEELQDDFSSDLRRMGAINAYSRKLDNYQITVMGEVPVKTVQIIGDGMQFWAQP